jgi:hypothetical protein
LIDVHAIGETQRRTTGFRHEHRRFSTVGTSTHQTENAEENARSQQHLS